MFTQAALAGANWCGLGYKGFIGTGRSDGPLGQVGLGTLRSRPSAFVNDFRTGFSNSVTPVF